MLNRRKCPPHLTLEERLRFVGWTERVVDPALGPCHEWNGARSGGTFDYGHLAMPGEDTKLVHRHAYRVWVDPTLSREDILRHRCDNPPCMNTRHLEPGTRADNSADAVKRHRVRHGERHHSTKLTDAQVRDIRAVYVRGITRQKDIAAEYGVSVALVNMIVNGKTRRHLT